MDLGFIKIPYTTSPSMTKNKGRAYNPFPKENYLKEKKKELKVWGKDLYGSTKTAEEEKLVEKLSEFLGFKETKDIRDIALRLEEDIAIMHKGILASICFCFPSSWIPSERLGLDLGEVHSPVAEGEQLVKASKKISKAMDRQDMLRWIWTVTTNPSLSNHPKIKRPELIDIGSLYLRVETQTTTPLDKETSLFFVKVDVHPLTKVWSDKILESINSMSNEVLEYKNLFEIKDYLNKPDRWFN